MWPFKSEPNNIKFMIIFLLLAKCILGLDMGLQTSQHESNPQEKQRWMTGFICFLGPYHVQQCVCVYFIEKKKPCGRSPGENNHATAAQIRWAGRGQGSRQQAQTTAHQSVSAQTPPASYSPAAESWTSQNTTEKKAKRYYTKGGQACGEGGCSTWSAQPRHTSVYWSSIPNREMQRLDKGRADCGLVEAASVSGRGNALISPVTVKDSGACKADPGFVLHCLCFRVTATT